MTIRPVLQGRFIPSLAALAVFALFVGLWLGGKQPAYEGLLTLWGIIPYPIPFVDIDGPLSALDCARKGLDVIAENPCDLLNRPYNYSPLLLSFDWLPLGGEDRIWVGFVLDLLFIASLALLPPPVSRGETWLRTVAAVSTMVVFAAERVNTDVAIFVLVVLAYRLLLRGSMALRSLGYGIVGLVGAVKYYPIILLALALRERRTVAIAVLGVATAGFALLAWQYGAQTLRTFALVPRNSAFGDTFGRVNLPVGLYELARGYAGDVNVALLVVLILAAAALTIVVLSRWWQVADIPAMLERLDEPRRLSLLIGILLIDGCFFGTQNVSYRGIFLLFVLPGLSALQWDALVRVTANIVGATRWAIVLLMWYGGLRLWLHVLTTGHYPAPGALGMRSLDAASDLIAWLLRELAWWAIAGTLLILLLGFAVTAARQFGFGAAARGGMKHTG